MREESVDGTLSPVSFKGGMDTLDNDTSGRRKVRSRHNVCCSWQRNFAEHNIKQVDGMLVCKGIHQPAIWFSKIFKTALQMKIFVDKCPMKILCLMFKFMKYCENNREIVLPPLLFTPPTSDIKTELWNKVGRV